jgi:hypothetical protein
VSEGARGSREDASAEALQYALRSSYYYRQARRFAKLVEKARRMAKATRCEWRPPAELGISEAAGERLAKRRIAPELIFCHPAILAKAPGLAEYHRSIAALPQKGLARLLRQVAADDTDSDAAIRLCRIINGHPLRPRGDPDAGPGEERSSVAPAVARASVGGLPPPTRVQAQQCLAFSSPSRA